MATGYQGYQGYGSPERAKVERERRLAELLQQGVTDTGPKSLWEGVAQLGKAFIARDAMGRADKAEGEYGDSQKRALDLFLSQMGPDGAGTASVSQAPTPGSGDAKARLMAKANPEGTDPHAAMAAPATAAAPAPSADPNAITKTDLPPISDAVVKATQWAAQQGLDPALEAQNMQTNGQSAPATPSYATATPPAAPPQAGMNPAASIANVLMQQQPQQMQPKQQPFNFQEAVRQAAAITGDVPSAIELVKSMQPEPVKPITVNNRLVDGRTGELIKDFSDPKPRTPIIIGETAYDPETYEPVIQGQKSQGLPEGMWYGPDGKGPPQPIPGYVDMRARIAAAGRSPDGPQLTPYQMYQIQRDADKDAATDRATATKTENAMYSLQEGIGLVDKLVDHEGFKTIYGMQGALPVVPGTDGADALAMLEQIGGQAFLAGVETMRGTGPLSDNEGRKVAAARTRLLNRGQSAEAAAIAAQEFNASMQRLLAAYEQESGIKLEQPAIPEQRTSGAPDFNNPTPPAGLPPQLQQAWKQGNPRMRQMAWSTLAPNQQAFAMGGQGAQQAPAQTAQPPAAAADLGDDELRAMLGL